MKSLLIASAAAAVLAMAIPTEADAKTKVKIFLGMPHYGYQVGPDYRFRDGYGWYQDTGYYDNNRGRLSCGEARRVVRNSGFRNVSTIECNGRTYTFEATRRGRDVTVFVNSRTGALSRG
jgi:hypothetical protein